MTDSGKVLPFFRDSSMMPRLTPARGNLTSQKPSQCSVGRLSATVIRERLRQSLSRLDGEQLQVVEIVVAAIRRGA